MRAPHFWLACALLLCLAHAACVAGHANLFRKFEAAEEAAQRAAGLLTAANDLPEMWYTQKLDHFSFRAAAAEQNVERTWQQRYFQNLEHYRAGGPVFLYIGGESELRGSRASSGFVVTMAQKFGGAIFALEHRFYGRSHPFPALHTENLVFLTVEQALEDAATFIQAMNAEHKFSKSTPWVSVGGSYPGVLSAFIRQKYPHLIAASLASSAPILAKADFWEYDAVVGGGAGPQCSNALREANTLIEQRLDESPESAQAVRAQFGCQGLDAMETDVGFLYILADAVAYALQYTNSNPRSPAYQLKELLCDTWMLNTTSAADPAARFAGFFGALLQRLGDDCPNFTTTLAVLKDTSTAAHMNQRAWYWQSCLQWGFFQVAPNPEIEGQPESVRSKRIDLAYHEYLCKAAFDGWEVLPAIAQTNSRYGGLDVVGSRIFYTNGDIDPWNALGLLTPREAHPSVVARMIHGTAHCADLSAPDAVNDPADLTKAREEIMQHMTQWLTEFQKVDCPPYLSNCNNECVDTQSNVLHCGSCNPPTPIDASNSTQFYCLSGELLPVTPTESDDGTPFGKEMLVLGIIFLVAGFVALVLGLHALRKVERVKKEAEQPMLG